jgi:hypothetical protein
LHMLLRSVSWILSDLRRYITWTSSAAMALLGLVSPGFCYNRHPVRRMFQVTGCEEYILSSALPETCCSNEHLDPISCWKVQRVSLNFLWLDILFGSMWPSFQNGILMMSHRLAWTHPSSCTTWQNKTWLATGGSNVQLLCLGRVWWMRKETL